MQVFAALILNDNLMLTFINNTAERAGGAIFQYSYNRDFFASRSCFISYKGEYNIITNRNITFLFQNNTAGACGRNCSTLGQYGHSVAICNNSHTVF